MGVSRDCNILALKALADAGEGTVSDILNAMDRVITYAKTSGRRSVVSMSFGGPCEQGGEHLKFTFTCSVSFLVSVSFALSNSYSFSFLYFT